MYAIYEPSVQCVHVGCRVPSHSHDDARRDNSPVPCTQAAMVDVSTCTLLILGIVPIGFITPWNVPRKIVPTGLHGSRQDIAINYRIHKLLG